MSTDNWMSEENGIPHKNGSVRFYLIGYEEDVYGYLGWHDMTDWDEGWEKVWAAAEKRSPNEAFQVLRHDQLQDLQRNVQYAFEEALEDKDETTWLWWHRKETAEAKAKGEMK
jgi:hypothetical protein